jgi:hypothetical protein
MRELWGVLDSIPGIGAFFSHSPSVTIPIVAKKNKISLSPPFVICDFSNQEQNSCKKREERSKCVPLSLPTQNSFIIDFYTTMW